jgi:hypothetical protein
MAATEMNTTTEELLEVMLSVQIVQRLYIYIYNKDQRPLPKSPERQLEE